MVVAAIVVIGLALVVYARTSVPEADASPPTADDHWHAAYGYMICDTDGWRQVNGDQETEGTAGFQRYARTGVHSHDDGVIHWHPFTSASVGRRAQLGVFHDVYGVDLDNDSLRFPEEQGGEEYIEGETKCGDEDAELKVIVWESFSDTDDGSTYISDFDDIRLTGDGMVFAIAFVPKGTDVEMPQWAAQLPELGAVDSGQTAPTTPASTVPGSAVPGASTVPGTATVPGGTTPDTGDEATGSTAPAATAAAPAPNTTTG